MPTPEPPSHTFLLRIWIEATPEESGRLVWRGFIAHLPDEERIYVESFDEITRFIWRTLDGPDGGSLPKAPRGEVHDAPEDGRSEFSDDSGRQ